MIIIETVEPNEIGIIWSYIVNDGTVIKKDDSSDFSPPHKHRHLDLKDRIARLTSPAFVSHEGTEEPMLVIPREFCFLATEGAAHRIMGEYLRKSLWRYLQH
jgi:hypothetical protein